MLAALKPQQKDPDFTLTDLKGKKVSLSDFRGKGVVLNFWATWCSACRAELFDFQKVHQNAKGFVTRTVNLREDEKTVE
ncbi:MAG: TlpA family protein disulfide reductase [Firmicutes bacterium]|nr:TlpA family protein disulfide reductase [Bacillota bacterium]